MCTTDFCNDLDFDIHSGRARPVLQLPGNRSRAATAVEADLRSSGGAISAFLERQQELRDNGSYSLQHQQQQQGEEEEFLLLDDEVGEDEEEEEVWGEVGHGVGAEEEQRADRVPRQVAQGRKCD